MRTENLVVLKGTVDGIMVILDEAAPFDTVAKAFESKLMSAKKFFEGAQVHVAFKGRKLTKEEQEVLLGLLRKQNILNVSFVHAFEQSEALNAQETLTQLMEEINKPNVSLTQFHYGMVRSGQHLHYKGSIVILGDVNPGGEVTADGNIIVLGTLNGKVHAGMDPTITRPFVLAINMHPLQISIGKVIAQLPDGEVVSRKKHQTPQIAYVANNTIYVDEIDVKTLAHMVE